MSVSKAKGTAWESAIVRYLREQGFMYAERRTLSGTADKGDIAGIPSIVIEAKSCQRQELAKWLDEATVEAENARVPFGVVWAKRKGTTSPGQGYVIMDGETFTKFCLEHDGNQARSESNRPRKGINE